MPKRRREGDLSARISSIINTAPDYGEEEDDFTKVQQLGGDELHSDSGSGDELNLAQFRKINIELLDADDEKYAGVRASRRDVEKEKAFGSESSDDSDEEIDTGSLGSEAEASEGMEGEEESEEQSDEEEDEDSDESMASAEEDNDSTSDKEDEEGEMKEISAKVASDVEKGHAIRNQYSLWDSLLECRIKFQKCLTVANKLPQCNKVSDFKEAGGEDFANAQKSCQTSIKKVLNSLVELQTVALDVNTRKFEEKVGKRTMDDEITSSSDSEHESEEKKSGFHKESKRRKIGDIAEEIKELHESLLPFRNETIQKWNDKTRVTQMGNKDFSAFEQSTLKQIEMVLADKQRLLKRTRTKRSNYHILGEDDEGPSSKLVKTEECSEIFDDDDFYHQLLRELLERKASDVTDPVQLSRQWIELQKARSKMKRPVDQRASKGRKLRYNVHQKLVNFMMPIDNTSWTDEARAELFTSLFGKKV